MPGINYLNVGLVSWRSYTGFAWLQEARLCKHIPEMDVGKLFFFQYNSPLMILSSIGRN